MAEPPACASRRRACHSISTRFATCGPARWPGRSGVGCSRPGRRPSAPAVAGATGSGSRRSSRRPNRPWSPAGLPSSASPGRFAWRARTGSPRDAPKLWRYNLHYFDFLSAPRSNPADKAALINDWIARVTVGAEDAWEPYPISLRVVNWLKHGLTLPAGGVPREWVASLAHQVAALEGDLEYHLLANHLLKNGKALVFAGDLPRRTGGAALAGSGASTSCWLRQRSNSCPTAATSSAARCITALRWRMWSIWSACIERNRGAGRGRGLGDPAATRRGAATGISPGDPHGRRRDPAVQRCRLRHHSAGQRRAGLRERDA